MKDPRSIELSMCGCFGAGAVLCGSVSCHEVPAGSRRGVVEELVAEASCSCASRKLVADLERGAIRDAETGDSMAAPSSPDCGARLSPTPTPTALKVAFSVTSEIAAPDACGTESARP